MPFDSAGWCNDMQNKNGKSGTKTIGLVVVAFLMFSAIATLVVAFPDFYDVYDPDEWSEVTTGTGDLTFPSEAGWDWMGGTTVAPAFPNARVMVENSTGSLFVVYARAMAVGNDTRTGIELATSNDLGATWTETAVINGSAVFSYGLPSIDIDSSDNLHVAWICYDHLHYDSWINYANDSGGDWLDIIINKQVGWNLTYPVIQVNSSDVAVVVWQGINQSYHSTALFGWHTHRAENDTVYMLGVESPTEEGIHDSYKYPSVAIAANDTVWVSFHQVNVTHTTHRVGVAHYDVDLSHIAHNKTFASNQSRNACIALNETGSVVVAYKSYNATDSSIVLSIQNSSTDYSLWTHITMDEYTEEGTWIYPSVAVDSSDEIVVTSMVASEIDFGWFWGNATIAGLDDSDFIEPPHDYILYSFTHLKWNSHNRNGQDFADQTLWILELVYGDDSTYLSTSIVLMGQSIDGSYTHPSDPTPLPTTMAERMTSITEMLTSFFPVVIVIGIIVIFLGIFMVPKGGKQNG